MKGNRLYQNLPMEILTSIKKDAAANNQFEEPRGLYILAMYYEKQMIADYGAERAQAIIEKYRNMTYEVSTEQKRLREEAQKRAEEKREARDQAVIEMGKRAQIRIDQRNKMLEIEEKKLKMQEQQPPKEDEETRKAREALEAEFGTQEEQKRILGK